MEEYRLSLLIRNAYVRKRFEEDDIRCALQEKGKAFIRNMLIGVNESYIGQKREMRADVTFRCCDGDVLISSKNHHLDVDRDSTEVSDMDTVSSLLGMDVAAADDKRLMSSLERGVMIPSAQGGCVVLLRLRRSHGRILATGLKYMGRTPYVDNASQKVRDCPKNPGDISSVPSA